MAFTSLAHPQISMYPKDFFATAASHIDSGLCFVIMPFDPKFLPTWEAIRSVVEGPPFNMLCRRADDVSIPGNIVSGILERIWRARIVVADLTDRNPNVFYELGLAHSVKPATDVILLSAEPLPFDVSHLNTVIYHGDLERLTAGLSRTLEQLGIRQYPLVLQEGQKGRIPGRLTGEDRSLYDVDIAVQYIGDDGVKFQLTTTRYAVGHAPSVATSDGYYLGLAEPSMKVPDLDWYLCYVKEPTGSVRFILGGSPALTA